MAVREFRKFYKSYGRFGRNPTLPTSFQEGQGGGNGVAMKAHVLALWDASRCPNRSELDFVPVFEMGVMTHGFPPAVVVSAVFAEAVHLVVLEKCSPSQDVALFFETLWLTARRYEMAWNETYAKRFGLPKVKDEVSKRLELLMPCPHLPKLLNDPIAMREKIGTKCFALESVIFSIASFIRHPLDFEAGMEEVIAAGGDTDTNAAMYGALAGANGGLEIIPPAWREYNQGIKDTATLATRLYQTAKSLR